MLSDQMRARVASIAKRHDSPAKAGRVLSATGSILTVAVEDAHVGDVIEAIGPGGALPCEVVGFKEKDVIAIPLQPVKAIAPGAPVWLRPSRAALPVGDALLGRLIDPFGLPLDGKPMPRCTERVPVDAPGLPIHERAEVSERFDTGVRAIDGLLTCGRGQRVGIFAGAG